MMTRGTSLARCGWILAGLAAALAGGCPGPDSSSTSGSNLPRITACGQYAMECVPLAGSSPNSLAVGDLNGDGMPDVAVANMGADNLSVLLNNGNGTFTPSANYAVGDSPFIVKIGDWNGDGYPDLASTGGASIFTVLNNGDSTFRRGSTITLSDPPFNMTVADFDGDGDLDIAAVSDFARSIVILRNDGKGKFTKTEPIIVSDALQLGYITTADVDGDSRADLIAVNAYGGKISLLRGNGDGTFATPVQIDLQVPTHLLRSATPVDVDGDGHVDLAVADSGDPLDNSDIGNVAILRNDGTGVFSVTARLGAGSLPISIAAADFNRDGLVDLAVANAGSDNVSMLFGTGGGEFGAPENVGVGDGPSFVAGGDLNGDGSPDLAVTNTNSDSVSMLLNDGTGRFVPQE